MENIILSMALIMLVICGFGLVSVVIEMMRDSFRYSIGQRIDKKIEKVTEKLSDRIWELDEEIAKLKYSKKDI